MRILRLSGGLFLGLLVSAGALAAQQKPDTLPPYRSRILGVFDLQSGEPVEGAQVTDVLNKSSSLTTHTGTVGLFFLPDGGGVVRITKIGYEPQTLTVAISPTDITPITVMFTRVNELAPVVTTAPAPKYRTLGLKEFEDRRAAGFGRFVAEAELRKDDARDLRNVLLQLPGLEIVPQGAGLYVTTSRSAAGESGTMSPQTSKNRPPAKCKSTIYVDGVPLTLSTQDVKQLPPVSDLAGIEWYSGAAAIPSKYNATGNACGVLLLWTRER